MRALVMRLATAVSLLLVLLGWSVASPLGSSPDDDYHLASIWCSEYSYLHPCTEVPGVDGGASFLVPAVVIESHVCYAFQPTATANCIEEVADSLRLTDRINQVQGLYPGGFYTVMSLFASNDYTASVFAMRVANSLIVVVLLGAFLLLARPFIGRSALLVLPVMFIPLAVFLFVSTNPSSWTIAGSIFYFLFGLNALMSGRSRRVKAVSLAFAVASALLAMSSRVDASAFIVIITVALVALAGREVLVESKAVTGAVILTGLAAFTYFLFQGLGPAGSTTTIGESTYVGGLFVTNVLEIPGFLGGAVGGAPLGWLDTRMPGLVGTVGLLAIGALAFWGLAQMDSRKSITATFLLITAFGVPVLLAQQQRIEVLEFIQARYLLPLLFVLLIVVVTTLPPRVRERFPLVPHGVLSVSVAAAGIAALWVTFHRFAYGADVPYLARDLENSWSGLLGSMSIFLIWLGMLSTVAFVALMMGSYRSLSEPDRENLLPVKEQS